MSRLNAEQILNLNILNNEDSADDSCDESELDIVEADYSMSSDTDACEEETEETIVHMNLASQSTHSAVHIKQQNETSFMYGSNTIDTDMIDDMIDSIEKTGSPNKVIDGRANKSKLIPFQWYSKPNKTFETVETIKASIIPILEDESSIEFFLKCLYQFK